MTSMKDKNPHIKIKAIIMINITKRDRIITEPNNMVMIEEKVNIINNQHTKEEIPITTKDIKRNKLIIIKVGEQAEVTPNTNRINTIMRKIIKKNIEQEEVEEEAMLLKMQSKELIIKERRRLNIILEINNKIMHREISQDLLIEISCRERRKSSIQKVIL